MSVSHRAAWLLPRPDFHRQALNDAPDAPPARKKRPALRPNVCKGFYSSVVCKIELACRQSCKPHSVLLCCKRSPTSHSSSNHLSIAELSDPPFRSFPSGQFPYHNLGFSQMGFTSFHSPRFQGDSVTVALSGYSEPIPKDVAPFTAVSPVETGLP